MSVNAEDICTTNTMINLKNNIKECLREQLAHDTDGSKDGGILVRWSSDDTRDDQLAKVVKLPEYQDLTPNEVARKVTYAQRQDTELFLFLPATFIPIIVYEHGNRTLAHFTRLPCCAGRVCFAAKSKIQATGLSRLELERLTDAAQAVRVTVVDRGDLAVLVAQPAFVGETQSRKMQDAQENQTPIVSFYDAMQALAELKLEQVRLSLESSVQPVCVVAQLLRHVHVCNCFPDQEAQGNQNGG